METHIVILVISQVTMLGLMAFFFLPRRDGNLTGLNNNFMDQ